MRFARKQCTCLSVNFWNVPRPNQIKLANIFEVSILFPVPPSPLSGVNVKKPYRDKLILDCFERNPYSSQDSRHISLGVLLAINILHTHYFSMLCRNLFFAVLSVLMYVMFLNLQPPRHPVLWRKGARWYLKALSLDKPFHCRSFAVTAIR